MIRNRAFLADVPHFERGPDPADCPEFRAWCHEHLFCVVTLDRPFDLHHLRRDELGPSGVANHDDRRIIPVVARLHRPGYPGSIHTMGEQPFFEKHGIEYQSLAAMIWVAYDMGRDVERAQKAILEAMPR